MSAYLRDSDLELDTDPGPELLQGLSAGDRLSGAQLLTWLDGREEEALEEVVAEAAARDIVLDITDLPYPRIGGELAVRLRLEQELAKQEDLLAGLGEDDPLAVYLRELAGIPAAGDVDVLSLELPETAPTVLNLSLSRVVELAKTFTGRGVLLLDLIQEGSMGLWQSLERYPGGDFPAFRDRIIRLYMAKAIVTQASISGLGQKLLEAMEDYRSVDERLLGELGRNPLPEELAEALHMTVQEVATVAQMLTAARRLSSAHNAPEEDEPQPEDEQAVEDTAYFQMRQRISELLSILPPEEAKVLTLRFGLEGGLPLSPEETGKKLGLTAREVVEAEASALGKLRSEG